MAKASKALWLAVVAGLLVALVGPLRHRLQWERASRSVEVAVDYDSYSEYFHAQGLDEDAAFTQLHANGASAVAFNEDYLTALQLAGHLKLYSALDLDRFRTLEKLPGIGRTIAGRQYLVIYDDGTFNDMSKVLKLLVGDDKVAEWGRAPGSISASPDTPRVLEVIGSERFLTGTGLGFSTELVDHFRKLGFDIVLRPENKTNVGPDMIQRYFAALPKAEYVVFGGTRNEALGYPAPACLDAVLQQLSQYQLRLGIVEVPSPKQALKGQEYLSQHDCQMAVRVQSIAPGQQSKMQSSDALDMFQLGVRERNVRMVFLRPFADPDDNSTLLDTNNNYVKSVAGMLHDSNFNIGLASVFPDVTQLSWKSTVVLNIAVGAALSLLLLGFWPQAPAWIVALGPVGMTLGAVGAGLVHHAETWSNLSALTIALTMPSLAMMYVQDRMATVNTSGSRADAVRYTFQWFGPATAISLGGGVLVASLLAYTPFMLEIDQFRGIKLLMIVPPLLALLYAAHREGTSIPKVAGFFWRMPLTIGSALCLLVAVAGGVFFIMRTGNTPEAGASDFERWLRVVLEHVFVARPRFKDFCIGHPAFVVLSTLTVFSAAGRVRLRQLVFWGLLALASIGQADIVDTCAHIHTPFLISLLRIFHGCWLGLLVGLLLAWCIRPQAGEAPPSQPGTDQTSAAVSQQPLASVH